jgi:C4-dicarboxylate-specific signal transduction histidine kinase
MRSCAASGPDSEPLTGGERMGAWENPEAAFLAHLTASATHELRNVLAVVKESAGLIEDLTAAAPRRPDAPERVLQAARRIDAQVGRGADLLTGLNRLAHGLDHEEESNDLGALSQQILFLYQRFIRQRRQRFEVAPGGGDRRVRTNALRLQMALAAAVDCCLEQLPEEAREFFLAGVPASLLLLAVLALFVWLIWPAMGMPVLL